ncbi:unnamed protein product, partial [Amoebophrya sp. A25]
LACIAAHQHDSSQTGKILEHEREGSSKAAHGERLLLEQNKSHTLEEAGADAEVVGREQRTALVKQNAAQIGKDIESALANALQTNRETIHVQSMYLEAGGMLFVDYAVSALHTSNAAFFDAGTMDMEKNQEQLRAHKKVEDFDPPEASTPSKLKMSSVDADQIQKHDRWVENLSLRGGVLQLNGDRSGNDVIDSFLERGTTASNQVAGDGGPDEDLADDHMDILNEEQEDEKDKSSNKAKKSNTAESTSFLLEQEIEDDEEDDTDYHEVYDEDDPVWFQQQLERLQMALDESVRWKRQLSTSFRAGGTPINQNHEAFENQQLRRRFTRSTSASSGTATANDITGMNLNIDSSGHLKTSDVGKAGDAWRGHFRRDH